MSPPIGARGVIAYDVRVYLVARRLNICNGVCRRLFTACDNDRSKVVEYLEDNAPKNEKPARATRISWTRRTVSIATVK